MTDRKLAARLLALSVGLCAATSLQAGPDWTYWVGPQANSQTGVSNEKNLPDKWDPRGGDGSNVIWAKPLPSRSTPVLMNGRLYMLTNSHEDDIKKAGERVVCVDATNGEVVWQHPFNVYLSDVPIERVGWSSVVCDPQTGNVYAQGVCGYFVCLRGNTGEVVWQHSLHEEFGVLSTYGGRTNYPMIHENNVLISAVVVGWGDQARPNHRFLALDKHNGQPVWFAGTRDLPKDTTYSAPVLAVINGELQMIFGAGDGSVYGYQPRTGKKLWSYDLSAHGLNSTPLVVGNRVYIGHAEENLDSSTMGALVCIDASQRGDITKTGTIWKKTEYALQRSSPIAIDGRIYFTVDSAKMHCVNADTGEEIGEPARLGTMMRANLLYADGKIYAGEVNGRGYILKPTAAGSEIIHQFRYPRGEECHGSPIAANGRIFIPTTGKLYCIGLPGDPVAADAPAERPTETPTGEDQVPTQLVISPAECLLRPNFAQDFQVRLYNSKGQYLRLAKYSEVAFTLDGPGKLDKKPTDEQARYEIAKDQKAQAAAFITAKVGAIEGKARIRIVPDLDWSFNFDDGKVPTTWVGVAYRHVPMDWDLITKLRAEDPKISDLYIYLVTEFTNYAPSRVFDDATPQQRWTNLLRFFEVSEGPTKPKTVDEAKAMFNPGLQRLLDEKMLASFEWTTWQRKTGNGDETVPEPRLTVRRGDRGITGNGVLCKVSTIPLGTRSQGWMGLTDLHDYTIQTDLLTYSRQNKLPDAGIIAQRYTFDLMGASQQLQLRTWTAQLNRFSANQQFTWAPNIWYTMKFSATTEPNKAVLRAKVWKRGETEPADWMISAEDLAPNLIGSPGLFGNCKDGELFYDNLTVMKNQR